MGSTARRGKPMTSALYPRSSWPNLHQSSPQETSERTSPFPTRSEVSKQSYCSLLITMEVINTSHTLLLSFKTTRYWLMPTSSLWSWDQETNTQEGGLSFSHRQAELRSELGVSWASPPVLTKGAHWSLWNHRTICRIKDYQPKSKEELL